jgi:hypothetical protein
MNIFVWSESGLTGCGRKDEIEIDDDSTDEQIEEAVREWFFEHNEYGWSRTAPEQ